MQTHATARTERTSLALTTLAFWTALVVGLGACNGDRRDAESSGHPAPAELTLPEPRAGGDVVGRPVAALLPERWIGERFELTGDDAPRATLVRFWTDTCPYCARSLPEIEALRGRYAASGFATLGVYHPKPARDVEDETVRAAAERLGYMGPLAVDPEWTSLRAIWLDRSRDATSASFLLDHDGVVRYAYYSEGPEDRPSVDELIAELSGSRFDAS